MDWIRLSDVMEPVEFDVEVVALTLDLGYHYAVLVDPVRLHLGVSPTKHGHSLQGAFPYRASLPCSRCLKPVVLSGEASFLLEYQPAAMAPAEEEVEAGPDAPEIVYYQEDRITFQSLVAQQMYLEVPEKVLCGESCRGLCPRCGADLNQGDCPCPPDTDPRWDHLTRLTSPQ
ncbi:MAG: YceD family protein [Acidobacteriota bacterium]